MRRDALLSGEISPNEKILLARGGRLDASGARIDVLVSLAADPDEQVRRAAQETLERLPDEDWAKCLAAPSVEGSVARYFLEPSHLRPALLPLLLGHPDAPQDAITAVAASAGPKVVTVLLDQLDLLKSPALIALRDNPTYLLWQKEPPPQGYVLEVDLLEMLIREQEMEASQAPSVTEEKEIGEVAVEESGDESKGGIVRKIAKMKVAQRVKLALLGTREERVLLIRDSSRVVCRAVLSSPKLTDSEVEGFAAMRNVSQDVLRLISMSRKFMTNYIVLKNLMNNPRTPIDAALPQLNRLMPNDLRAVAGSKEVPDTTRKTALKLQKARAQGGEF